MSRLSTPKNITELAPALVVPNSHFQRAGFVQRRGQFSIIAAAPGVGKTILATNLAVQASVPTLYFSADSDEFTVLTRAAAILTGHTLDEIERNLEDDSWADYYAKILSRADHVDWCYNSDIDPEFIALRVQAYAEMQGEYPWLIVVDNLGNTVVEQDNEASELKATCRELQRLARLTGAHVIGTHHVTGPKESGWTEIGLGDLLYKIGKISEQVIGLHHYSQAELYLNIAKNRGGRSGFGFPVGIDYARATIDGFHGSRSGRVLAATE